MCACDILSIDLSLVTLMVPKYVYYHEEQVLG